MKENRIKKIFEILTDDSIYYTANDLSEMIGFSSKTIRKDIKELNSLLKNNGAVIESKPGVGYRFLIKNKDKFYKFIKEDWPIYAFDEDLNNQEFRVNQIILILIKSSSFLKSEKLLDLLFISRSQLNQDLKVVREILSENNIYITSKPHYGIKLKASEIDMRSLIVKYIEENSRINNNILEDVSDIGTLKINEMSSYVLKKFKEYGFDTNLVKYNNFINYLIVSISRINMGHLISNDNKIEPLYEKYSSVYKLSSNIAKKAEQIFDIIVDDKEIEYLYINLLSKIDSYTPSEYNENIEQIIERTLIAIKKTLSIDLTNDSDLKSSLMIHLAPMIKRVKYGIKLKNPLLEDIKKDHLAIECAKLCSSYIREICKININTDELGYIALHFSAALAKSRDSLSKKNILLICASGRATAKVLKYRFMHEFSKYINILDTSDYLMAMNMELNSYDIIVSTIPIHLKTKVPIIEVSAYLFKSDVDRIRSLLENNEEINEIKKLFSKDIFFKVKNKKTQDRDEVLNELVANNYRIVNKKDYYKELINRENIANTGLENKIAIPHPLNPISDDNFIGLYINPNGINRDGVRVNIVFLLNFNDKISKSVIETFFKYFSEFLNDNNKILEATRSDNLHEFWKSFFKF